MFKTILTSRLLGVSRNFIKLFQTNLSLHTSKAMLLKQIKVSQIGEKLIIEGINVPSQRKDYVIENNNECCSLCNLNLNIKHTDVLILSQYVRPDGCMMPQRITGLCKTQQKRMTKLVSMAHKAGLMCSLAPKNSKQDPSKRKYWKKYNTYFDESTIKSFENHFLQMRKDTILKYMKIK